MFYRNHISGFVPRDTPEMVPSEIVVIKFYFTNYFTVKRYGHVKLEFTKFRWYAHDGG